MQSLLDIFEKKMRLQIPMFHRQCMWKQDLQWAPLGEDNFAVTKFAALLL